MLLHPFCRRPIVAAQVEQLPQLVVIQSQHHPPIPRRVIPNRKHLPLNSFWRRLTSNDYTQPPDAIAQIRCRLVNGVQVERVRVLRLKHYEYSAVLCAHVMPKRFIGVVCKDDVPTFRAVDCPNLQLAVYKLWAEQVVQGLKNQSLILGCVLATGRNAVKPMLNCFRFSAGILVNIVKSWACIRGVLLMRSDVPLNQANIASGHCDDLSFCS